MRAREEYKNEELNREINPLGINRTGIVRETRGRALRVLRCCVSVLERYSALARERMPPRLSRIHYYIRAEMKEGEHRGDTEDNARKQNRRLRTRLFRDARL